MAKQQTVLVEVRDSRGGPQHDFQATGCSVTPEGELVIHNARLRDHDAQFEVRRLPGKWYEVILRPLGQQP